MNLYCSCRIRMLILASVLMKVRLMVVIQELYTTNM